jgi:bifunctional ADP-heptose synthase (sugar kinase/adenylyltransferase)
MAAGASAVDASNLANAAAGVVVAHMGTIAISRASLSREI